MQISPARRVAFQILRRVEDEQAYSSALLANADVDLNSKDRALMQQLVLGVLRSQLWLDGTVRHFVAREIDSFDLAVVIALRLGLYQLRFLSRIPASAAINESVNLVKAARVKSAAGLVNAVLRRATREPDYDPAAQATDEVEKVSIQSSHPRWLIERWADQFGFAEAAAIAQANNQPAPTSFRLTAKALHDSAKSSASIIAALQKSGTRLVESEIAPGAWRLSDEVDCENAAASQTRTTALLREFSDQGLIYFQDEGSQLVAQLLEVQDRDRILDVCAAPGSKATLLAALSPTSTIIACDLYEHRVRTMKQLASQQQATNVEFVIHDATQRLAFASGEFDRVLVDAPCSGTGTLRHHPEIRWRLQPSDFAELVEKQKLILTNAAEGVREGRLLLYSTCSLETDENEAMAADFLEHHSDFEPAPLSARADLMTKTGAVRTWPHRDAVDGFFAMAFRRKS